MPQGKKQRAGGSEGGSRGHGRTLERQELGLPRALLEPLLRDLQGELRVPRVQRLVELPQPALQRHPAPRQPAPPAQSDL